MALRSLSLPASLAHRLLHHRPASPCVRACRLSQLLSRLCSTAHPALSSSRRFHTSSLCSAILSPPSASQSDPDPTLLAPLAPEDAPSLKAVLDPALWFPDAEIVPAPPTAKQTADAAAAALDPATPVQPSTTTADDSGDGSAEAGGLYYTTSHPNIHPIAPIAEAVAPLPCAYTPPDIAPMMKVDDIKRAMEHVILSEEEEHEDAVRKAAEAEANKTVEVKGLDELLEDVQAEEAEEAAAAEGSALVVDTVQPTTIADVKSPTMSGAMLL